MINNEKQLLALGRDQNNNKIFSEISELDLSLCLKINVIKICPHSSQVINKEPFPSCLFHLYFSQHQLALKSCRIFLQQPKDTAIALSKDKFVTFTSKPSTYDIFCKENNTKQEGLQLLGVQTIHLQPGCSAQLPYFLLNSQSDFFFTEEAKTRKWTLPPSALWSPSISEIELEKAYNAVKADIGLPKVAPIDISIVKSLHDPLHYYHPPSLISLALCAFLLIVFMIIVILICKAYRRESKYNNQPFCPPPPQVMNQGVEMYPLLNNVPKQN